MIVGVVIVIAFAPEAVTVAVVATAAEGAAATEAVSALAATATAVSEVATYGKVGLTIGKWIDTFQAKSVAGHLIHGYPDVLLGPSVKAAARADLTDTIADCDGSGLGFEGSSTVFIGKEHRPMSRRQDRLRCNGIISEGESSIIVGGAPSAEGKTVEEEDRWGVKMASLGLDTAGLADPFFGKGKSAWQAALGSAQVLAEATGHDQLSSVLGTPTSKPSNLAEAFNSFNDGMSTYSTVNDAVSPSGASE